MKHILLRAALGILITTSSWTCCLTADEPLHVRIDALVAARFDGTPPAPLTDDAAFCRRVTLDLAGCIPNSTELQQFLADPAPDKRARWIDHLLAQPTYPQRMRDVFHVMWMERRGDNEEWLAFLHSAFANNTPWDAMVRQILAPDASQETTRGAAFFYTKRLEAYGQNPIDFPGVTRDIGRLFLGVDLQCAQCHDHLFVDDYKQLEFQGLHALVQQLSIQGGKDYPAIQESPFQKKHEFISVFQTERMETVPRVPFGKELPVAIPPGDGPAVSSLQLLASHLASADNPWFVRNAVNRLWFIMMGRGLVDPLDMHHSANPPTNPELLDLLSREFVAHGMDVRWLLREMALSETYQRSSVWTGNSGLPAPDSYLVANEKRLSAEQLFASFLRATGEDVRIASLQDDQVTEAAQSVGQLRQRFLAAFANEPREPELEYQATVKAALFLLNDPQFLDRLKPHEGMAMQQFISMQDPRQLADTMFLQILSRHPTDEERLELDAYLTAHRDHREIALRDYVWAMLTSVEFCLNH